MFVAIPCNSRFSPKQSVLTRALSRALSGTALSLCATLAVPDAALAQAAAPGGASSARSYAIPPGPLGDTLARFSIEAGVPLSFPSGLVAGLRSEGLNGTYDVQAGFARLLQGTGLELAATGSGAYTLRRRQAAPAAEVELQPVTVTASATAERVAPAYPGGQVATGGGLGLLGNRDIMDTPFSLTAYTQELIQAQQASSIADVVNNDASVRNVNPRAGRFDQFSIRGFPVLNSDIALNGLYGVLPTYAVAVEAAERIEILKGPSALLNGMAPSGAVGGAINVVSKRAPAEAVNQFTLGYASDSTFGGHADVARRFGERQEFGVRFNAAYKNGDTSVDPQSLERSLATLGLDYRGTRLRLSADFGYQQQNGDAPQERVTAAAGVPLSDASRIHRNYAQPWTFADTRDSYVALRGEYDVSDDLEVYGAFGARRGRYEFLRMAVAARDAAGNFASAPFRFLREEDAYTSEIGARARFATGPLRHQLNVSASVFHLEAGNLRQNFGTIRSNLYNPVVAPRPSFAGLSSDVPKAEETELSSLALADTISALDERVQLTLGARLQRVQSDSFDATGQVTSHYDERAVTPAVALVVRPWKQVSFYGNYIEGLSQGPTAPSTAANAEQMFAPIKSRQLEAGVKVDFGSIATTLSAFRIEQPTGLTDPATNVFSVAGKQRNTGLEWNVFGEPVQGVRVLAGAMYLNGRLRETAEPANNGNVAPGTPRYNLNAGVEWDTPFLAGLTLSARVLRSTSQYLDAANRQRIPAWTRTDIGARYTLKAAGKRVTVRAAVENLFDKSYWASASANGLTLATPRTFLVSTTVDF